MWLTPVTASLKAAGLACQPDEYEVTSRMYHSIWVIGCSFNQLRMNNIAEIHRQFTEPNGDR
jgi:hypothetical protein